MFRGFKELSDRERLILSLLPEGEIVGDTKVGVWIREKEIIRESGLTPEKYKATKKKLIAKKLIEEAVVEMAVQSSKFPYEIKHVNANSLRRYGKSVMRRKGRSLE